MKMHHFKRKTIKVIISALLLVTLSPGFAFADTESATRLEVMGNYSYTFWCGTEHTTQGGQSGIKAFAWVREANQQHVPVGHMGIEARLYNEGGALKKSSNTLYNEGEYLGLGVETGVEFTSGRYYAQGLCHLWNGSRYTSWNTFKTPYDTLRRVDSDNPMYISEYQINSLGETYGSALSAYTIGEEPELIAAIGVDGTEGYVKACDLSPEYFSPEEMVNNSMVTREIPLYDSEGNTIGSFMVNGNVLYQ